MTARRGAVLVEALLLLVTVLMVVRWHQEVIRRWNEAMDELQRRRKAYDGVSWARPAS